MKYDDLIDKYMQGNLSAEEENQFLDLKANSEKFRNALTFHEDLKVAATESERNEITKRLKANHQKTQKWRPKKWMRVAVIIAGLTMLGIGIWGLSQGNKQVTPEMMYASNYEVYPNVYFPVTRGNSEEIMTKAFTAYENGNYKLAAEMMEEKLKTSDALELKFYQAICYGEMGNLPLAIRNLENIRRFNSDYIDESYWYLGMYYLKQGNTAAARERLQTFLELSKDEAMRKKAVDMVMQLN